MVSERPLLNHLGLIGLVVLAFSLPFELDAPLITLARFRLTNVEALLLLCQTMALLVIYRERRWRRPGWTIVPKPWLWLWALFALALIVSALLAPDWRLNALKATVRTLSGLLLAFAVPQLVRGRRDLTWVVGGLLAGGLLAAAIGLAEVLSGSPFGWLYGLRLQPTEAGPFLRLSGSFNHANQAAMYIEATLPLLVTAGWLAFRRGRHLSGTLLLAASLLYLEAGFLTFSRASFATIFLSNLFVAVLLFWGRSTKRSQLAFPWAATSAFVVLLVVVNSLLSPVLRLRLTSEGDNEWYNLNFEAPGEIQVAAGEATEITLVVANQGSLVWSSSPNQPFRLGARWYLQLQDNEESVVLRWPLARTVRPGESITMTVPLTAPTLPGAYWLEWDMVQEEVTWFAEKNGQRTRTRVNVLDNHRTVRPGERSPFPTAEGPLQELEPLRQPIPDRRTLWLLAGRQLLERPVVGIGLDNFRLTYGKVAGWQIWDTTIHTNNWYVETLVSLGVIGSLPFLLWLVLLFRDIVLQLRRQPVSGKYCAWQIGLAVGLVSFMIHGLLDYFLLFNGTAYLFWILVGLWAGQRFWGREAADKVVSVVADSRE
jgi:hypothetical protein